MKKNAAYTTKLTILMALFFVTAQSGYAMSSLEKRELKALDPQTRLEQRCDIEAMARITKDTKYSPDKAIAYAFSEPKISPLRIRANGAAFRVKQTWYRLSYDCQTGPDAMTIKSFHYKIGSIVPRSEWAKHYLVP